MASAPPATSYTKATTNYARLCRLLVDGATFVLRDCFDTICSPPRLAAVLEDSQPILQSLRLRRIINATQWGKLFPAVPTSVSSRNFDPTLLMILLRNVCGLTPPLTGWDALPAVSDVSREADIARISWFRNSVCAHSEHVSVDDATFNKNWKEIRDTLVRLGGATYKVAIDNLECSCMDPDMEHHYEDLLLQWKNDEDNIKDELDELVDWMASSGTPAGHSSDEDEHLHRPPVLKVTLLGSEWGSSKGGFSTFNRELAIHLAKCPGVEINFLLPQCSQEDRNVALRHNVKIVEGTPLLGLEPLDFLCFPPENLEIDFIVGQGVKLGKQAQVIKNYIKCKWLQVVHTYPEELGMFRYYPNPTSNGKEKQKPEVELCQMADLVVGVGFKVSKALRSYLRRCQKDDKVHALIPGVLEEFENVEQASSNRQRHAVLLFGRGDEEDFMLQGIDIAGKAIATLPDTRLVFVGAQDGKREETQQRLIRCGIPRQHLVVRGFVKQRESLKHLFQEVDLVVMPSRAEGFGLTGLEALSAGLPVLVSHNSGFGEALCRLPFGSSFVIDSEDPADWAKAIKEIWAKDRKRQLEEVKILRDCYDREYNWAKQTKHLVEEMITWAHGSKKEAAENTDKLQLESVIPKALVEEASDENNCKGEEDFVITKKGVQEMGDENARWSTKITDIPSPLYNEVCLKLDTQDEVFLKDYRLLGRLLGYSRDVTCNLGQKSLSANATDKLLQIWSQKCGRQATVGRLVELLKDRDLRRMDVAEILQDCASWSTEVNDIPFPIYGEVCLKLNIRDDIFRRDYRMLGEKLGISRDTIRYLEQSTSRPNPTDELLQMWSRDSGHQATVGRLIELLKGSKMRMDVVEILEDWMLETLL